MSPEQGKYSEIRWAVWSRCENVQGDSGIIPLQEILPAGIDAKIGQRIRFFRIPNEESGDIFAKAYEGSRWQADAEISNTQLLTRHEVPGVVPILDWETKGGNSLILYPFIEGNSFHHELAARNPRLRTTVMEQTAEVLVRSNSIEGFRMFRAPEGFLRQYPFREAIFADAIFKSINEAYCPFWQLRRYICETFPGMSMDRTPRNIIIERAEKPHQTDFEIVYSDSPLFDLAKLLRNGPESGVEQGVTFNEALASPKRVFWENNPFSEAEEREYVQTFTTQTLTDKDRSLIDYCYKQVAAHTHIFYIAKYLRRYLDGRYAPEKENCARRLIFHFAGLFSLEEDLLQPYIGRTDAVKARITAGVDKEDTVKLLGLYKNLVSQLGRK